MDQRTSSISRLGFGCMRLPLLDEKDPTSIDIEHFKRMVDAYIEAGGNYFDTAFVYHNGTSETALREALVKRYPRESFFLATKCLAWAAPDEATAKSNLATSLERLGTDYVDFYLLHNVGGKRTAVFDSFGMWDFVAQAKEQGLIRNVGFSMHDDAKTLDALLKAHPEVDFVQLQVNYLDWDDSVIQSRKCLDVANKHGKPIIIMEPVRGGRLAGDLPERVASVLKEAAPQLSLASWALRFCYEQPGVLTTLSGMSTEQQVRENMRELAVCGPFSAEERRVLDRAIEALHSVPTVPCTNCQYCMKGCPEHVMIPDALSLLNLESLTGNREFAKLQYSWRTQDGPASRCIACGACEDMCPQKIDIINQLKKAAEHFE